MTGLRGAHRQCLLNQRTGENHILYIGISRWRPLTQPGQRAQVNFNTYNLPRNVFDEIRNSLISLQTQNIVVELLDAEDRTVLARRIRAYRPSRVNDRQADNPILFFPTLHRERIDSPIFGVGSGSWPGIPEHREEIELDLSLQDMQRIRTIQFRIE